MKKPRLSLILHIEADSWRDDLWRFRIQIVDGVKSRRNVAAGRGTPKRVMELAKEALKEAMKPWGEWQKD